MTNILTRLQSTCYPAPEILLSSSQLDLENVVSDAEYDEHFDLPWPWLTSKTKSNRRKWKYEPRIGEIDVDHEGVSTRTSIAATALHRCRG